MKTKLEEICFWKKSYDKENKIGSKLSKTFEDCSSCEGYKNECKHYSPLKEYLNSVQEEI